MLFHIQLPFSKWPDLNLYKVWKVCANSVIITATGYSVGLLMLIYFV